MAALVCLASCPDTAIATTVPETLVEARLAACVNIVPGLTSVYRWQDQIRRDEELLLVIKTHSDRLDALRQRIDELHPYELPELIAVEAADGLPAYLDWVRAETRPA